LQNNIKVKKPKFSLDLLSVASKEINFSAVNHVINVLGKKSTTPLPFKTVFSEIKNL